MDIKIHGLTRPIVEEAIRRTREARLFIMDTCMKPAIAEPRKTVGEYAPKIIQTTIDPAKIGEVVGQRGKVINAIIEECGVKIDITDDGELLSTKANLKLINGEGTLALPSLVSKIGMGAFSGVEGLKTIIIPSSVKEIGDYAFSYNKEIERVVIEGDLKRIGHYAFDQATNLREINLPNSISEIGIFAFRNTQISEVTVPKNVQTISVLTFGNCSKLKKIVLQEGLKTIEGLSLIHISEPTRH